MAMSAILRRLQAAGIEVPQAYEDETHLWNLPQKIEAMDIAFLRRVTQSHIALNFEYSVHCARLAHGFLRKEKEEEAVLIQEIEAALTMAQLLEHVYQHQLKVPREVERLRRDQVVYRKLLASFAVDFIDQDQSEIPKVSPSSKDVRDFIANGNWPRFFIIRSRRLLVSMIPFFDEFSQYTRFVRSIDQYLAPTLSYVAWLYFIPRLTVNLFLLAKHVIPGRWMSDEEMTLGWQDRLKAHLDRRWFELANDVVWFLGGLINCFMFIGVLAPFNPYFSVALQAYDVFLATVRTFVEMGRLKNLKQDYLQMLEEPITIEERTDILNHLRFLEQRIEYEQKRMNLGIINNTILLLAMCVALPVLAFHPIMPFLAAIVILANTIGVYNATKYLETHKPADKVSHLELAVDLAPTSPSNVSVTSQGMFRKTNTFGGMKASKSDGRICDYQDQSNCSPELK
jgi:hypothetical protein